MLHMTHCMVRQYTLWLLGSWHVLLGAATNYRLESVPVDEQGVTRARSPSS